MTTLFAGRLWLPEEVAEREPWVLSAAAGGDADRTKGTGRPGPLERGGRHAQVYPRALVAASPVAATAAGDSVKEEVLG